LLPFSYHELRVGKYASDRLDEALFHGAYPPVFDQRLNPVAWYNNYIETYLERDVRQILNVRDLIPFQRFIALCAGNIGQLFNASRLGADCGMASVTMAQWLSVLEGTYIAFRLQPYFKNFRKRVIKTPKLYFWDTGLAIRLLGIQSADQLATHPLRGALFENWVVSETMKTFCHRGERANLFFWRDSAGLEVDLLQDAAGKLHATEIKSGATFSPDWAENLLKWRSLAGAEATPSPSVVYGGDATYSFKEVRVISWQDFRG